MKINPNPQNIRKTTVFRLVPGHSAMGPPGRENRKMSPAVRERRPRHFPCAFLLPVPGPQGSDQAPPRVSVAYMLKAFSCFFLDVLDFFCVFLIAFLISPWGPMGPSMGPQGEIKNNRYFWPCGHCRGHKKTLRCHKVVDSGFSPFFGTRNSMRSYESIHSSV